MRNELFDVALRQEAPSKAEMQEYTSTLAQDIDEGKYDKYQIVKMLVYASAIVEQFEEIKKAVAARAASSVEQITDTNTIEMYGAKLTIKKGADGWDFSEDEEWSRLDQQVQDIDKGLKIAKKKRAAQEAVLKLKDDAEKYLMWSGEKSVSVTLTK